MRRLRARPIAGAAEVKFLTAGNVEFTAGHRVKAVVWLGLVPLLAQWAPMKL
jgi:hypothetical protein